MTGVTGCYTLNVLAGEDIAQPQISIQDNAALFFGIVNGTLDIYVQFVKNLGIIDAYLRLLTVRLPTD
jgi:hypothetical protein